jgi:uncharacterized OB-fold protein
LEKQLIAFQCKSCGTRSLIAHGYCTICREKDSFQGIKISGKGTIFSFTRIFVAEERFQAEAPYIIAVIESEEGLRLIGRIKQEDSERLSIGRMVELEGWKEEVPIFKVS